MISIKRVLAGIFLIFLVASISACGGPRHHVDEAPSEAEVEERAMNGVEKAMDKLGGTEQQTAAIQAEVRKLVPRMVELREMKEPTRDALVAEFASGAPDQQRVAAIVDDVFDQGTSAVYDVSDSAVRVHGILTPEQRAKIVAFVEAKGDRWKDRRRGGDKMRAAMVNGFLDEIEATDEQSEFVLAKVDEFKKRGEKLKAQREPTRKFFLEQFASENPDSVAIQAKIGDLSTQLRVFAHDVSAAAVEFTNTLTPDQQARIKDLIAQHRRN